MERENILKASGYSIVSMWECDWKELKKTEMTKLEKKELENKAELEHIELRDALFGGRTEAFKSYYKCNGNEQIFDYDIVSLYPSVNALDKYPVGFKQFYNPTIKEILDESFIGVVKCDVTPPTNLYIPVLPENSKGKLLFHVNPMSGTWCSVELKKAIEKGYKITKIHAGFKYKSMVGLMKKYVEFFLKIKTCNSGVKNASERDLLNTEHQRLGLDIHITPEETAKNPGMKQMAKLCLNSLWGKFGQRSGMDNYEHYMEADETKFSRQNIRPQI